MQPELLQEKSPEVQGLILLLQFWWCFWFWNSRGDGKSFILGTSQGANLEFWVNSDGRKMELFSYWWDVEQRAAASLCWSCEMHNEVLASVGNFVEFASIWQCFQMERNNCLFPYSAIFIYFKWIWVWGRGSAALLSVAWRQMLFHWAIGSFFSSCSSVVGVHLLNKDKFHWKCYKVRCIFSYFNDSLFF